MRTLQQEFCVLHLSEKILRLLQAAGLTGDPGETENFENGQESEAESSGLELTAAQVKAELPTVGHLGTRNKVKN